MSEEELIKTAGTDSRKNRHLLSWARVGLLSPLSPQLNGASKLRGSLGLARGQPCTWEPWPDSRNSVSHCTRHSPPHPATVLHVACDWGPQPACLPQVGLPWISDQNIKKGAVTLIME